MPSLSTVVLWVLIIEPRLSFYHLCQFRLEFLLLATKSILPKPGGLCLKPETIFLFSAAQKVALHKARQALHDREKCNGSDRKTKHKTTSKMPQGDRSWNHGVKGSVSNIDKTGEKAGQKQVRRTELCW